MLKPLFAAEPSPRPVSIPFIGEGEDWGKLKWLNFLVGHLEPQHLYYLKYILIKLCHTFS